MITCDPMNACPLRAPLALAWGCLKDQPATYCHSCRVAVLAALLAVITRLGRRTVAVVYVASILHDIGKSHFRDLVLKPGAFTDEERLRMQEHPVQSWAMVQEQDGCIPTAGKSDVLDAIRHHHELKSGRGYPDGLTGAQISAATKLVTVADIYDAVRECRPHRSGLSSEETSLLMAERHLRTNQEDIEPEFFKALQSIPGAELDRLCSVVEPVTCTRYVMESAPLKLAFE